MKLENARNKWRINTTAISTFDRFFLAIGTAVVEELVARLIFIVDNDASDLIPWLQNTEEVWNSLLSIGEWPREGDVSESNELGKNVGGLLNKYLESKSYCV